MSPVDDYHSIANVPFYCKTYPMLFL